MILLHKVQINTGRPQKVVNKASAPPKTMQFHHTDKATLSPRRSSCWRHPVLFTALHQLVLSGQLRVPFGARATGQCWCNAVTCISNSKEQRSFTHCVCCLLFQTFPTTVFDRAGQHKTIEAQRTHPQRQTGTAGQNVLSLSCSKYKIETYGASKTYTDLHVNTRWEEK